MKRAIHALFLASVLALGLLACEPIEPPATFATPLPSPARSETLPIPSVKDLGSPDPPATVQPIASP